MLIRKLQGIRDRAAYRTLQAASTFPPVTIGSNEFAELMTAAEKDAKRIKELEAQVRILTGASIITARKLDVKA